MSAGARLSFAMIRFVHETMYVLLKDPVRPLEAAGLREGQTALEVGCGPGHFTLPAARLVGEAGRLIAIDVNPYAVKHVAKKLEESGATNATARLVDATATDFDDGSFDLAFVFGLPRVRHGGFAALWPELHRVLRVDGTLAVEGRTPPPSRLFAEVSRSAGVTRYRRLR
jgi:ubiquinone/menaquinone biosynthesis C-methylase UbiE